MEKGKWMCLRVCACVCVCVSVFACVCACVCVCARVYNRDWSLRCFLLLALIAWLHWNTYIYSYILLRSNSSRHYIAGGVRRRGKTGKRVEVGVKRRWWVLANPPYSPQENGRQSPWVELGGRPPDLDENPGSQYLQRLGGRARPQVHSRYIHLKQE